MLNENRILNITNTTSTNSSSSNTTPTGELSSTSKAYLYAFTAPAALAVIFFITLIIIKRYRKKKQETIQINQANNLPKKLESEQETKLSSKTTSRIGLTPDFENNPSPNKNSSKITSTNDVFNLDSHDRSNDKKLPIKSLWRMKSSLDDKSLSKLGKLRQTIYKKKKTDSYNNSFSKSSFSANKSNSQIDTFNKTREYLAVKLSNMEILANVAEDNNSEYRQTEQSARGNSNYLFDQLNLLKLKGMTNDYQNTDKNEDMQNSIAMNDSNKESILEENNEDDIDEAVSDEDNSVDHKDNIST